MKKKLLLLTIIVILSIFVAACGSDTNKSEENSDLKEDSKVEEVREVTVKHPLGETLVKVNPKKVVVFDMGILDTLDTLGIEVTAVPQSNVPPYLEKYADAKYENAGGLKEPDFEKIAELGPDVIIISTRQQDSYEELSKIAPTIFLAVDNTNYMDSFKENMSIVGEVFEKTSEIDAEIAKIEASIEGIKAKAGEVGDTLVVLANEGNISAYGPGSRFGIIHDVFGLTPVDTSIEIATHGQNISPEYIVEKDPDYLFVVDRNAVVAGQAGAKETIETDLIKNTKVMKNGQIVYLDPNYWYLSGGGLVSVAEMIKSIEEGIK